MDGAKPWEKRVPGPGLELFLALGVRKGGCIPSAPPEAILSCSRLSQALPQAWSRAGPFAHESTELGIRQVLGDSPTQMILDLLQVVAHKWREQG